MQIISSLFLVSGGWEMLYLLQSKPQELLSLLLSRLQEAVGIFIDS